MLLLGSRGPRSAFGPAAGELVLLADAGFVGEPDLYVGRIDTLLACNRLQCGGELFLNASMAPAAWV